MNQMMFNAIFSLITFKNVSLALSNQQHDCECDIVFIATTVQNQYVNIE